MAKPQYTKLKREAKRAWLKALRSGKYRQATGHLCDNDGSMCCLGVLADVAIDTYWVKGSYHWDLVIPGSLDRDTESYSLSQETAEHVRLDRRAQEQLIRMNDEQRMSFAKIADWVEEYL